MSNPHEKLAMEFFSPPGPSAREWHHRYSGYRWPTWWSDGAEVWPMWQEDYEYEIRLKPQTITLPERTIPKPLSPGALVGGEHYYVAVPTAQRWVVQVCYDPRSSTHQCWAERGVFYRGTDEGKTDAIAAAKGMRGWRDEG